MQRPGIKPVSGKHSTSEPPMLKWEDFGSSLINQNLIVQLQNIISNPFFRVKTWLDHWNKNDENLKKKPIANYISIQKT